MAAVLVVGCGRVSFDPIIPDAAVGRCTQYSPFSPPTRVDALATVEFEFDPNMSTDGTTMYFSSNIAGTFDIYQTRRASRDASWETPAVILATADSDVNPAIAASDLELFHGAVEVRRLVRTTPDEPWSGPEVIIAAAPPFVSPQGADLALEDRLMVLCSALTTGEVVILESTRVDRASPFSTPTILTSVAPATNAEFPAISQDGLELFVSLGPPGEREVALATRPDLEAPFGAAVVIPELASTSDDSDPDLSADGTELIFASNRPGSVEYDLWSSRRTCLETAP